jgi:IclR family KDG regulon transcriptional repressor
MSKNHVSTLKKGLLVLEEVKRMQGISLAEVMDQLELSKSTAFRLLTTLEDMNYIYKIQSKYFFNFKKFGPEIEMGPNNNWTSLRSIHEVAKKLQMSTYVGKMDGTDLVMTQVLHEPFLHTSDDEVGNRSKVHLSALGKVILAYLEEEELNAILDEMALEPATANTFQDSQLFRYHLKAIKEDGFAFDDEERNVGIRCVAVPVFRDQKVIAALAIAEPTERISRRKIKQLVNQLDVGSQAVTKEIETLEKK